MTLVDRIKSFLTLKPNWDSYSAPVISPQAVWRAADLMEHMQAVPTNDGGVQLECHTGKQSIEIEIDCEGNISEIAVFEEPSGMCRELGEYQ